jgi:hypothetical protein
MPQMFHFYFFWAWGISSSLCIHFSSDSGEIRQNYHNKEHIQKVFKEGELGQKFSCSVIPDNCYKQQN